MRSATRGLAVNAWGQSRAGDLNTHEERNVADEQERDFKVRVKRP